MQLSDWRATYIDRWYPRSLGWVDGTTKFHDVCRRSLEGGEPNPTLLEIGSGPRNISSEFFSTLGHLTGVDTDPIVMENPALDAAYVVTDETLPFDSGSFDACFSNWVLEHVEHPETHLREVERILKPGGCYIARTPNLFHYVSLAAACTPQWIHDLVANRLRALPEQTHEPWPTYYRLNTRAGVRRTATKAGLAIDSLTVLESEPSYGMSSRVIFLLFMAYERLVNSSSRLEGLRHSMIVVLRKTAKSGEGNAV